MGRRQVLVRAGRTDPKIERQADRSSGFQHACDLAESGFLILGGQVLQNRAAHNDIELSAGKRRKVAHVPDPGVQRIQV